MGSSISSASSGVAFHDSGETDPGERGRSLGAAQADAVANTIQAYRRIFAVERISRSHVMRSAASLRERLAASTPHVLEEIEGIAAGARQDSDELIAINARTELRSAAPPECSTVAILPDRGRQNACLMAQNWDYHPELRASRVIWRVAHPNGRLTTFTEAGILAKIGLNSEGLGVCLNGLRTNRDAFGVGIPIHLLIREVLEHCSTFPEAEALLRSTRVSASACITIGQMRSQETVVASFELSPQGTTAIYPPGTHLVHTNHFLMPLTGGEDAVPQRWPDTLRRYEELIEVLSTTARPIDLSGLQRILSSHASGARGVCCHVPRAREFAERSETLASIVMDLARPRLWVSDGSPCQTGYREFAV